MLSKQEALRLLHEHVSEAKKIKHMMAVSAIMKGLAKRLHMNEDEWELAGLLHDLDFDMTVAKNKIGKHGLIASKILEGKLPKECLHAIQTHDLRVGAKPETFMDKALIASDCLWYLIVRTSITTSNRNIRQLKVNMMKENFRDESFPKHFKKGIMMCKEINLTPEELFEIALKSLPQDLSIDKSDR
jgi:hypothetical protein